MNLLIGLLKNRVLQALSILGAFAFLLWQIPSVGQVSIKYGLFIVLGTLLILVQISTYIVTWVTISIVFLWTFIVGFVLTKYDFGGVRTSHWVFRVLTTTLIIIVVGFVHSLLFVVVYNNMPQVAEFFREIKSLEWSPRYSIEMLPVGPVGYGILLSFAGGFIGVVFEDTQKS